jgi:hypothetical protein
MFLLVKSKHAINQILFLEKYIILKHILKGNLMTIQVWILSSTIPAIRPIFHLGNTKEPKSDKKEFTNRNIPFLYFPL